LQGFSLDDSSSQFIKNIYSMIDDISLDDIHDEKELQKVINFFEYCGTFLCGDGHSALLENKGGKKVRSQMIFSSLLLSVLAVLRYNEII